MCGLVAICDDRLFGGFFNAHELLVKAMKSIRHRGYKPIIENEGHLLIGHTRLAIQGLGAEFDQPVMGEKGFLGAYVGEIFNAKRFSLGKESDVPLMMDMLRHPDRDKLMHKFDGFWSTVHTYQYGHVEARTDHLGIKPLYLHEKLGIIASELRAIECLDPKLQPDMLYRANVLKWGYDPTGRTPFEGVSRLKPGHKAHWVDGSFYQKPYWTLKPQSTPLHMRNLIDLAIKDRLIGDLPVAVLCSGGLDSTIVALVAAQSGVPITVLHCLVDELDTEHFRSIKWPSNVKTKEIVLDMAMKQQALRATEEPVDLGSVVPQYALGKAIAEAGFNVVLTGDGADEVFGGYTRARTYDSQYSDIFCELVNYHLPRLDKTMMANTVELRSPFLAHYVIEQALLIPYHQRTRKQALKEIYADIVPEHILNREKVPLKTDAVKNGGFEYRKDLVDQFYKQRGML